MQVSELMFNIPLAISQPNSDRLVYAVHMTVTEVWWVSNCFGHYISKCVGLLWKGTPWHRLQMLTPWCNPCTLVCGDKPRIIFNMILGFKPWIAADVNHFDWTHDNQGENQSESGQQSANPVMHKGCNSASSAGVHLITGMKEMAMYNVIKTQIMTSLCLITDDLRNPNLWLPWLESAIIIKNTLFYSCTKWVYKMVRLEIAHLSCKNIYVYL